MSDDSLQKSVRLYEPRTDHDSGGLVGTDVEHYMVHQGKMFSAIREVVLASGATDDILMVTPSTGIEVHMEGVVSSTLGAALELYEAATGTPGTPITVYNRKREGGFAATLALYHTNAGVLPGTTRLLKMQSGAGRRGGLNRGAEEWVLKPSTQYLVRVTSVANGNNVITMPIWYEVREDD